MTHVWIRILGIAGAVLWAATVLARDAGIVLTGFGRTLLGVAPNLGLGLLLPMLVIALWPTVFRREIGRRALARVLAAAWLALLGAESAHAALTGGKFDPLDVLATLVAFLLMGALYRRP